jgi:radical SAM superfamily enzyme YgiQ (UPF0313 family)
MEYWRYVRSIKKLNYDEDGKLFYPRGEKFRIALVYPNEYSLGISNLGFQYIYFLLNSIKEINCERFFISKSKLVPLSLETQTPIYDFPLILFSFSFENDYLNFFKIRRAVFVEQKRKDLIFHAGGIAISLNPDILSSFLDFVFLGYFNKEQANFFTDTIKKTNLNKEEFLNLLNKSPAFYIPSFKNKKKFYYPNKLISKTHSYIFYKKGEFANLGLIELTRGCSKKCNFCINGNKERVLLHKDINLVEEEIKFVSFYRSTIGLIGSDVSNFKKMKELCLLLKKYKLKASFSSLNPNFKDELFKILSISSQKTVTLAPENNERIRFLLNKKIKDDIYIRFAKELKKCGVRIFKLYFLIGFPNEFEDDVVSITEFVKEFINKVSPQKVLLKIGFFVPKKTTSFETLKPNEKKILKRKVLILKKNLSSLKKLDFKFSSYSSHLTEFILSTGNKEAGEKFYKGTFRKE